MAVPKKGGGLGLGWQFQRGASSGKGWLGWQFYRRGQGLGGNPRASVRGGRCVIFHRGGCSRRRLEG